MQNPSSLDAEPQPLPLWMQTTPPSGCRSPPYEADPLLLDPDPSPGHVTCDVCWEVNAPPTLPCPKPRLRSVKM